jgi:hypothetical protein
MDHRLALQPLIVAVAIAFALPAVSPSPAVAQDKQLSTQQQRMKDCNAIAGRRNLSGDARKDFMSDCLSGNSASGTSGNTQQEKMKSCNAKASDQKLTGDVRQRYMSNCLKS